MTNRGPKLRVPGVLVGIPCERALMVEALDGIVGIAGRMAKYGWTWFHFGYQRTEIARNRMAHCLLEQTDVEYLCMLDSDHQHPPDIVERLLACCLADPENIKIVGGMNYRRGQSHEPMAYLFAGEALLRPIVPPDEPKLMEVDAISTSAIMIHRSVFETMTPPWFQYRYDHYSKGFNSSEDIIFCRRVRAETTFKVWVHTGIISPHLMVVGLADDKLYREWLEDEHIQCYQQSAVSVGSNNGNKGCAK